MANGDDPTKPGFLDTPQIKAARKELQELRDDAKVLAEDTRQAERNFADFNKTIQAGTDLTAEQIVKQRELRQAIDDVREATDENTKSQKAQTTAIENHKKVLAEWAGVAKEAIGDFSKLGGSVAGLTKEIMAQAHSLDAVSVELSKTTGYASAMHDNMVALADSSNGLNLSFAASGKIIGSLSLQYKSFNALNEQSQRSLAETVGRLHQLGVDAGDSATAMDMLDNSMGLSRSSAAGLMKEFEGFSMSIGRPVSGVLKDFNALAGTLARFGDQAPTVFKELAGEARKLGLEVQKAFDIAELFDTFQSSAEVVGKLNSQLGIQLNSVELMGASHEDRLKMLRAEFDMQGTSFDSMGKRQKQMIAQILKVDEGTAARLFGDPMELRRMQRDQEAQQERLARFVTAADKIKEAFEQMFVKVEPILTAFTKALGALGQGFSYVISTGNVLAAFFARIVYGVAQSAVGFTEFGKGVAALSKGMLALTGVASILVGVIDGFTTGDVWYGMASGLGSFAGAVTGAFLGSLLMPGPGTLIGGILGGMVGGAVGKGLLGATRGEGFENYATGGYTGGYEGGFDDMAVVDGKPMGFYKGDGFAVDQASNTLVAAGTNIRGTQKVNPATGGAPQKMEQTIRTYIQLDSRVIEEVARKQFVDMTNMVRQQKVGATPAALGY